MTSGSHAGFGRIRLKNMEISWLEKLESRACPPFHKDVFIIFIIMQVLIVDAGSDRRASPLKQRTARSAGSCGSRVVVHSLAVRERSRVQPPPPSTAKTTIA